MQKIVKYSFYFGIFISFFTIILILATNAYLKPSLPKIKLVDEAELQMPLKVIDLLLISPNSPIKMPSFVYTFKGI